MSLAKLNITDMIKIKPLLSDYEAFMWQLLYDTIFVARENELADRDLEELPTLKRYIKNWGDKNGDEGYVAIDENNQPLGAVWVRLFNDEEHAWGYIDSETPELNIAIDKRVRNNGIGTLLLEKMFESLSKKYKAVSLSVNVNNRCVSLYKRIGFNVYKETENELVMRKTF